MDSVMEKAQDSGKVRTLLGRLYRCRLRETNQCGIHKQLSHDAEIAEHGQVIRLAYK